MRDTLAKILLIALAATPGLLVATMPLYVPKARPAAAVVICAAHVTHGAAVHCIPGAR